MHYCVLKITEFESNVSSSTIVEPRLKNDGAQLVHETITSVSMHHFGKT